MGCCGIGMKRLRDLPAEKITEREPDRLCLLHGDARKKETFDSGNLLHPTGLCDNFQLGA